MLVTTFSSMNPKAQNPLSRQNTVNKVNKVCKTPNKVNKISNTVNKVLNRVSKVNKVNQVLNTVKKASYTLSRTNVEPSPPHEGESTKHTNFTPDLV